MNCRLKSLAAAVAFAGMATGCATYDHGYDRPAYYGYDNYGPGYYGPAPYYGYYGYAPGYYVGPPVVGLGFSYSDRDRHVRGDRWSRDRDGGGHRGAYRPGANGERHGANRPGVNRQQRQAASPGRSSRASAGAPARADVTPNSRGRAISPAAGARAEPHG